MLITGYMKMKIFLKIFTFILFLHMTAFPIVIVLAFTLICVELGPLGLLTPVLMFLITWI